MPLVQDIPSIDKDVLTAFRISAEDSVSLEFDRVIAWSNSSTLVLSRQRSIFISDENDQAVQGQIKFTYEVTINNYSPVVQNAKPMTFSVRGKGVSKKHLTVATETK